MPEEIDPTHELPSEPPLDSPAGTLEAELAKAIEERDQLQDRLLRALADADNARKRAGRELADARAHAISEAVRPFLTVLDSFDLAARHAAHDSAAEWRKGFELLHRQLQEAARKAGLEPVAAQDKPFDPHQHEAIEMVDTDAAPEGTVVEELQRGYRLQERLIRPAMVKVARGKSPARA